MFLEGCGVAVRACLKREKVKLLLDSIITRFRTPVNRVTGHALSVSEAELLSCWLKVKGIFVHYKIAGKGRPVILLHGAGSDWRDWQKNIGFLAKYFRVYALDLPGYGQSGCPGWALSPHWFASFIDDFKLATGMDSPVLIGHSLGATVAANFAIEYPQKVEKLVLIGGTDGGPGRNTGLLGSITALMRRCAGKRNGPELTDNGEWDISGRLQLIKQPALIIWGARDPCFPICRNAETRDSAEKSVLYVFDRCGRAPHRDAAGEFNDLVYRFLIA